MSKIEDLYFKEMHRFRAYLLVEALAYELLKKYEYDDSKETMDQLYGTARDEKHFTELEKNQIIEQAINLLKIKYSIKVINQNPLMFEII